ncbi:MAG TPA: endonuclease/exonuclease/phosphatase family protein [Kiritimatiellia bacterium]|nr:endonuclease/exonuclease/phosphatase family protein [Kiritimatiellia bacterium]HRZ13324.1 endonuclease/exonuclease/phosphatase family protein [Kiritimatiellia bacterium]HSA18773.1 endonuclease/exonuclease/phosphatase family protein [Kiritimatiellia bacterium]
MKYPVVLVAVALAVSRDAGAAGFRRMSGEVPIQPPRIVRYDAGATGAVGDHVRLASYNIENFTDGVDDKEPRIPAHAEIQAKAAAALVAEIDPDILVIEEIENETSLELLNRALPAPYPVAAVTRIKSAPDWPEKLNLAVLSRLPIRGLRELDFGYLDGIHSPPRGLLSFYIELEQGRNLLVYAVHLKSNFSGDRSVNYAQRVNALRLLREDAESFRRTYNDREWDVLMLGDTNTDPDMPEFARDPTLRPLGDWVDLWRGHPMSERETIPTRYGDPAKIFPPAAFDRFVVTPGLTEPPWVAGEPHVLQKGVNTADITALPGVDPHHASDHYPVYLDIRR